VNVSRETIKIFYKIYFLVYGQTSASQVRQSLFLSSLIFVATRQSSSKLDSAFAAPKIIFADFCRDSAEFKQA